MSDAVLEGRPRIILVDDDEDLLKLNGIQLEQAGFHVTTCKSGEEALNCVNYQKPDIMLVDIQMPGINGWDVCRMVKSDPETEAVPIFFITCKGEEEDIHRHWNSGADGYFIKPFDCRGMVAKLLEVLEKQRIAEDRKLQPAGAAVC